MKKFELYRELSQYSHNDMILIDNEVIVCNKHLNDDWFELSDYADDEELGCEYSFVLVNEIDFEDNFEIFKSDECTYETKFSVPLGCVPRFNVLDTFFEE